MMTTDYDVVIAGGGMVGISLALALTRKLPACRILLVERHPLPVDAADTAFTPSFDARSTALSYASCLIYRELGLWQSIAERAQPIESIHVSDRGRFGSSLLQASTYEWPALGYVVENAWLGRCLAGALADTAVELCCPSAIVTATPGDGPVAIQLEDSRCLRADLLVVADGAHSTLREQLGIAHREHHYDQSAIIANIAHREPHGGRAFERFTGSGPLAFLPLVPMVGNEHRSALVWTLPPAEAEELLACPAQDFLTRLQQYFGYRLGRLEQAGQRHGYPLTLMETEEQVRSGVVVMGNAAHSLHPVAGQGFNLALRDVARLGAVLAEHLAGGGSVGDLTALQHYQQSQESDQRSTTAFSDRLPGLFMSEDGALTALRDLGLFALDLSPGLKREFVRRTAGLAPSTDYRELRP